MNFTKIALTLVAAGTLALAQTPAQTPAPSTTPSDQKPAQTGKKGSGKHHKKHTDASKQTPPPATQKQ